MTEVASLLLMVLMKMPTSAPPMMASQKSRFTAGVQPRQRAQGIAVGMAT